MTPFYEDDRVQLFHGCCLDVMRELPDESVHCCVTSPPYDNLRTYNGYSFNFEAVAKELYRILCPGGVLCWNAGDSTEDGSESLTSCKQKIYFREQCGFNIHDTMIYEKSNFAHPEHVRYHQVFEYVFILSKGAPRVFNPIKDKPNTYHGTGTYGVNSMRLRDGSMGIRKRNVIAEYGMRGNVWRGKTAGQETVCARLQHPAMMPLWLAGDLILSWSNEGDTVFDPFAGSCTTLYRAKQLGRRAIGAEISEQYCSDAVKHRLTGQYVLEAI